MNMVTPNLTAPTLSAGRVTATRTMPELRCVERQAPLPRLNTRCEAASVTASATGGTTEGRVGNRPRSRRAAVLRPRRLVGRDREIAEVTESVTLTPLTTVT